MVSGGRGPILKAFADAPKRDAMEDPADHPVADAWSDVLADMEATAASYEEDGWETQQIHPGNVTTLAGTDGDRFGLDVLVPDNEYAAVEERIQAGFDVDDYEVFTAVNDGFAFLLIALRDRDRRTAVFVPTYYSLAGEDTRMMLTRAKSDGVIHTYLRRLDGDYIEFTHDDPDLFLPSESVDSS